MWHILDSIQLVAFGAILPTALVVIGFIANTLLNLARGRLAENWPLPRSPWLLAFFIVLLGIPIGIYLQGSMLHVFLAFVSSVWFIAPCLGLLAVVAFTFWIRGHRIPAALMGWALVLTACIPAIALSYGIGVTFHQWQINAVRSYVERAMPVLDSIKVKAGAYPVTLPVSLLGSPPSLLRNEGSYSSDGKKFRFYYPDTTNFLGEGAEIDSISRTWRHPDDWLD